MLPAVLVFSFLSAYSSLGAFGFNLVSFSSIEQCGSFNVTFNGGQAPVALPLKLTVIPFNSSNPISIPISADSWDSATSTGAAVTFLPFAAGTSFVASLDDADSQGTGSVSDIITIQPSDNVSCIASSSPSSFTPAFQVEGPFSQCESFNVTYPITVPSVRVFRPLGPSFFLSSAGEQEGGAAEYLMEVRRGFEMAMLFDDGHGNQQTTDMTTVTGTPSSSSSCIPNSTLIINQTTPTPSPTSKGGLSRTSIIGIVVGTVGTVVIVAIAMGVWVVLQRRQRSVFAGNFTDVSAQLDGNGAEKSDLVQYNMVQSPDLSRPLPVLVSSYAPPTPPKFFGYSRSSAALFSETPGSPEFISYIDRGSERSPWVQPPEPTRRPSHRSGGSTKSPRRTTGSSSRRPSMGSSERGADMDIEQILDMTRLYTQPNSPEYAVDSTRQSTPDSVRTWTRSRANSVTRLPPVADEDPGMPMSHWAGNQTARRLGGRSGSIKYSTPMAQVQKIEAPLPNAVGESSGI
ncbi:hypothetical protein HWV62_43126 [Athelia sp. TMB]|nr:hypothetical protein HWV62_43126 [Athelia sp. TMB]